MSVAQGGCCLEILLLVVDLTHRSDWCGDAAGEEQEYGE
jgi:hypothetical protein